MTRILDASRRLQALRRPLRAMAGLLACAGALACAAAATSPSPGDPEDPSTGLALLLERVSAAEATIRDAEAFGSDAEQARGYMQLVRALIKALEAEVLQDRDYPYFRTLDFWLREGGDNPDQRYAFSPIRGGEAYRIWGHLGSARRVELQLYAGQPWADTGRSAGYLAFEDLAVGPDGSFEVELSARAPEAGGQASWLRNPPEATTVFVRHIYDDWSRARPGDVHIDRIGMEGERRPALTRAEVAQRLTGAAAMFEKTATTWPAFVQRRYVARAPANTMSPLIDTYALGGAKGRWMAGGHYALEPGQVLLVEMPATAAHYQAIQLTDLWFASLEYANQVSSLTTVQSLRAPDGRYYIVISTEDPGYPNWLDAGDFPRGVFLLRYDGVEGDIPEDQHPSARQVALAELPDLVPGFATVDEAERTRTRAARRHHLQLRSGR